MNTGQRYRETILFGNPDRIPLALGYPRESTLRAWKSQGLDRPYTEALCELLNVAPDAFLKFKNLEVNTRMIPEYEPVILEHKGGHYLVRDHMGATVEISDEFDPGYLRTAKDFVTRKWHKFPVENREDWLKMKTRYDPEDPLRLPPEFRDSGADHAVGNRASPGTGRLESGAGGGPDNRQTLSGISFNGVFWQLREWCGMENLCMMMLDDPDLVHEMTDFWADFISVILKKICARAALDHVFISEDMAYKAHSMISPAMTREFIMGAYLDWVPIIKNSGRPVIELDSDGCVDDLVPIWIESGINCCSPVEVAAHCDILDYRRRYGKNMAYMQGIDKRIIARGGKELERHVMAIVPEMFKLGGYIPGCDHGVPPDISWNNYADFGRMIAKLSGWI